jgi:hypothetical protein
MTKRVDPEEEFASAIPQPDPEAIREHILMLHTLASNAGGVDGVLTLTRIDDKDNCFTERFAIGDSKGQADAVINWGSNGAKLNLYVPWTIFRKDMPRGSKGDENHVAALLAFVGDLDSDAGKTGLGLDELPLPAPYVVESSEGNFQPVFPLGRALSQAEAKPIAIALSDAIGGDSGTKDTSHLWRIPGTLNWPTQKKIERGRSPIPQLVTIKLAWSGETVEPEAIKEAVKGFAKKPNDAPPNGAGNSTETFDDLPADLKKLIAARAYPGEDRSRTAGSVAYKLFRRGWSNDAIQALFERFSEGIGERYADGKTDLRKEIERLRQKFDENTFKDADPVDLWAKFDPPTLPRGVLPDVIERFAHEQGMTMGADMAGIAVGALVVCAAAIPDKIQLQVKRHNSGWLESARIWAALVGPVSTKKSPIMSSVVRPLRRIDSEMARQYSSERARYDKLSKEEKAETEPPKQTRVLLQDTTIEAAQEVLKDSPDGVLSYHDELSGWFGSMDKYSGSRGAAKDRAFWLEAYNGAEYSVNRVGRGASYIENLSVSILGGIQPEPIRKLADESMDDGLLQRLLPVVLRPSVEGRDEPQSDIVAEYSALIRRLHNIDKPMFGGSGTATNLRFDEGAQKLRQELERRHLELQSIEALNRKLAAHIGKYDGIFARLCVVWHCIENANGRLPSVITEDTTRRAAAFLHGFLLPHAVAFYAGTLGLSNDHDRLAAVAGYILARKLERITNRDVQRGDRTMRGLGRREIEAIFDQLDALGWISRTAPTRPTDPAHWIVNPVVHAKFAERAEAEKGRRERERETIANLMAGGGRRAA